ncbi:hypothetical protein QR680_008591 [Steinernema hermaphroditum]|uniref:Uncharacterized protein n=1 Tax=Steinernema hermaphroditum TaxID=289476 RepID=A0AA39IJL1_9BILA|nr:hypothetical protein QR680_008591 [Steinernema hermaphroditum]
MRRKRSRQKNKLLAKGIVATAVGRNDEQRLRGGRGAGVAVAAPALREFARVAALRLRIAAATAKKKELTGAAAGEKCLRESRHLSEPARRDSDSSHVRLRERRLRRNPAFRFVRVYVTQRGVKSTDD